jgi:heptosyltransferase-3
MPKLLFLKTKHLGDSVILTAAVQSISNNFMIDVFCQSTSAHVFLGNPKIDRIYSPPLTGSFLHYVWAYLKLFRLLRKTRYDAVIHFSDDWRGAIISCISGSRVRVCHQSHRRPKLWHLAFNYCVPRISYERHAAEQDMDLLRHVGLSGQTDAPPYALYPSDEAVLRVREWLQENGRQPHDYIIVNAATRWRFKTLFPEQWRQVIAVLIEHGLALVFSGSSEDKTFYQKFVDQNNLIACDFDLHETFALYRDSRALLSIDSLSIHVASAFKLPTFAIFGPSGEVQWRPRNTHYKIYEQSSRFSCRPCGKDGCESTKISQCLVTLDGRRIAEDFISFLRDIPAQ